MATKCPKCNAANPDTSSYCADCGTQLGPSKDIGITRTIETPVEEHPRGSIFADRYKIIEKLGTGGMGAVYRVEDTNIGQDIALKLIRSDIASDKKTIERFRNELKTTRMISHRNVCRMFDLAETDGTFYITMEYVSGEDLKSFIRRSGKLDIPKAISIAKEVCEGLSEAHRLGVVHRDLKSSNIMIDKEGNARIMDFGIARSMTAKGITGEGIIIGTPEYMSPEQAEAKEVDQRSDIYSLGVILYEMVTSELPFDGDTLLSIAMKHKGEIPKKPQELNPLIPDNLNKLVLRCMEKDRRHRYATVDELKQELHEIEPLLPSSQVKIARKKIQTSQGVTVTFSPRKLLIPVLVLVTLVIAVVLVLWQPWSRTESSVVPKIENSIAIISFENLTGDEAYDDLCKAVPNLLITNLEHTGFYYVVTWERMQDLLKQIGQANAKFIASEVGFELCRREGVESLVIGSITRAGEMFAVNVKVIDVETKNLLKSANSKGEGVDSILRVQIDELSKAISLSTGISPRRIESTSFDALDVTTGSMEAYTYYLDGVENKYYWDRARESLEMAVKLDPKFAYAYSALAGAYANLGDIKARDKALERAKSLSGKVTEKERLNIEATYANAIEGNIAKHVQILKQMKDKFPREKNVLYRLGLHYYYIGSFADAIVEYNLALELDPNYEDALNLLGYSYACLGDSEKAIEYVNRYAFLSPGEANPIDTMAEIYLILGRFEEAVAKYRETFEVDPDILHSPFAESYIHALREDYKTAIDRVDQFITYSPGPGVAAEGHFWKGFYYYWLGRIDRSLVELESAEDSANQINNKMWLGLIELLRGMIHKEEREFVDSRQHLETFYDLVPKTQTTMAPDSRAAYYLLIGLLDLREGRIDSAKSNVDELNSILLDLDPGTQRRTRYIYDFFHGEVLLADKMLEEAIVAGETISPPPLPFMDRPHWVFYYNIPFLKDILARAYQMKGNLDQAIGEYERLVSLDPASKIRHLIHPLYYYRLGKLYEEKDWKAKAMVNYEKFLDLWKDADPGTAEVLDARNRLATLQVP